MAMTPSPLGRHLAGLQLIRLIGHGAVARVYLASDGSRLKAVKVFPARASDRARRELEFGAGLDHPNLNVVEQLLDLDGNPALIMPFVRGTVLSGWLKSNTRLKDLLPVLAGITRALAHLAERGLVHRDVKPENVIVGGDGSVTLVDYDLGTRSGEQDPVMAAGTPAFLNPEQAAGLPVTPASDLYSLGVLAWWGLCREVPFSGDAAAVLQAHRSQVPRKVSELRPEAAMLDSLVAALLAKEPGERPGHGAVLQALSMSLARLDGYNAGQ